MHPSKKHFWIQTLFFRISSGFLYSAEYFTAELLSYRHHFIDFCALLNSSKYSYRDVFEIFFKHSFRKSSMDPSEIHWSFFFFKNFVSKAVCNFDKHFLRILQESFPELLKLFSLELFSQILRQFLIFLNQEWVFRNFYRYSLRHLCRNSSKDNFEKNSSNFCKGISPENFHVLLLEIYKA